MRKTEALVKTLADQVTALAEQKRGHAVHQIVLRGALVGFIAERLGIHNQGPVAERMAMEERYFVGQMETAISRAKAVGCSVLDVDVPEIIRQLEEEICIQWDPRMQPRKSEPGIEDVSQK